MAEVAYRFVADRILGLNQTLAGWEQRYGRAPGSVLLLAVSKNHPAAAIRQAAAAGQRAFGESYVQEAVDKMAQLADLDLEWHFIGPLQSNKTRAVATHFHWVHSVERVKIAERLSRQRPADLPSLNVCLQVNISDEASKSGVAPADLPALAAQVAQLPGLNLRGLMAIPAAIAEPEGQRRVFARMRELRDDLQTRLGRRLDTLSMGMSDDAEMAVAEGATIIRIGTGIFGPRQTQQKV